MYAIAFDLDTECLKKSYGPSYGNAYAEIRKFLAARGFSHQQGSLYYGDTGKDSKVTMVTAVMAATEMGQAFPWLAGCVTDIRILQLLNNDDLKPALKVGFQMAAAPKPEKAEKKPVVVR